MTGRRVDALDMLGHVLNALARVALPLVRAVTQPGLTFHREGRGPFVTPRCHRMDGEALIEPCVSRAYTGQLEQSWNPRIINRQLDWIGGGWKIAYSRRWCVVVGWCGRRGRLDLSWAVVRQRTRTRWHQLLGHPPPPPSGILAHTRAHVQDNGGEPAVTAAALRDTADRVSGGRSHRRP